MKQAVEDELRHLLAALERELGERNFFCGELSLADFAAVCYVPGARAMDVNTGEFPRLQGWMERMSRMPVVSADHERVTKALTKTPIVARTNVSIDVTAVSNGRSGKGLLTSWRVNFMPAR
jgi:glutathione S-transferase